MGGSWLNAIGNWQNAVWQMPAIAELPVEFALLGVGTANHLGPCTVIPVAVMYFTVRNCLEFVGLGVAALAGILRKGMIWVNG